MPSYIHGHRSRKKHPDTSGFSRTYNSWRAMKARCNNPKNDSYDDYGARGITYDERWETFEVFWSDMGGRPAGMTLERKDPDGPYCLNNCEWKWAKKNSGSRRSRR